MMHDLRKAGLWALLVVVVPLLALAAGVHFLPGGQKVALPGTGITATLTHVTDQRCPSAVDCFWEGMKRVEVLLSDGRHPPLTVVLCNLCEDGEPEAEVLGHRLTLIDLMPPVVEIEALGRSPLVTDYAAVLAVDGD